MSPVTEPLAGSPDRFPRVSGDEPVREHGTGAMNMFSPRERG